VPAPKVKGVGAVPVPIVVVVGKVPTPMAEGVGEMPTPVIKGAIDVRAAVKSARVGMISLWEGFLRNLEVKK
jgi:hypothetical protein